MLVDGPVAVIVQSVAAALLGLIGLGSIAAPLAIGADRVATATHADAAALLGGDQGLHPGEEVPWAGVLGEEVGEGDVEGGGYPVEPTDGDVRLPSLQLGDEPQREPGAIPELT